jgi:aminoglycoside 3-N-acetyltransferase
MSGIRAIIRRLTPNWILEKYRSQKKEAVRKSLKAQAESGLGWTQEVLEDHLRKAGLKSGDAVLVHSSLSKIGYINGGPQVFIDALKKIVGAEGHILMPNSPNAGYQLDYIRNLELFDVAHSASKLGAITETFRTQEGAVRSVNATEPVSCLGPNAQWFTEGHFGEVTPYTAKSPFARLAEAGGKILYVGVTLDNAGTSLHVLEDAVPEFKFPVYFPEIFSVKVKTNDGMIHSVTTKVHNPEQSAKRKCDELLPLFEQKGVFFRTTIGNAPTLVFDAEKMREVMISSYLQDGITMYTPKGN